MKTMEQLRNEDPKGFSELVSLLMKEHFGNIIIFDAADNTTLFMSDSVAQDLGCNPEEMVGQSKYLFQQCGYSERFVSDQVKVSGQEEYWSVRAPKTGNIQYVVSSPVRDRSGAIKYVVNRSMSEKYLRNFISIIQDERETLERKYGDIINFMQQQESERPVAESPAMQQVFRLARDVAQSDASVLLTGEPGVGKEVVARFIWQSSTRAGMPFVPVNCSAIPKDLVESEFFGYEDGAFTGAKRTGKTGFFEMANQGTLFLDEIGEMPIVLQPKLLRALDSGEIQRIGGKRTVKTDVRVISATNRDLSALIREQLFREDLYYRLNVIPIHIPPLRERKEDIPVLASRFLDRHNQKYGTDKRFSIEMLDQMMAYSWPGNVRELRNYVSRIATISRKTILCADMAPQKGPAGLTEQEPAGPAEDAADCPRPLKQAVAEYERGYIQKVLDQCGGNISKAARLLGIHRTAVYRKLKLGT